MVLSNVSPCNNNMIIASISPDRLKAKYFNLFDESIGRIHEDYWWPRLNASVKTAAEECFACQHADKSSLSFKAPVQPIEYPMKPSQNCY